MADPKADVLKIKKTRGVAGQYALTAQVRYPGERTSEVTFFGNTSGGPIVMKTRSTEVFVSDGVTRRIGKTLDEKWVRAFFA